MGGSGRCPGAGGGGATEGTGGRPGRLEGSGAGDPPRSGRLRRRAGGVGRAWRGVGPLRAHLVGRARHRPGRAHGGGRRPPAGPGGHALRGGPRQGPRARGHRHGGPHPWHVGRADQLWAQAGDLGVRDRPQPRSPAAGAQRRRRRQGLRSRRDLRPHPPGDRGDGVCPARDRLRACFIAGDPPRPPRRAPVDLGADRVVAGAVRHRAPPPAAERGRRGHGVVRGGPEGLVGDASQTQPHQRREHHRVVPPAARLRRRWARGRRPLAPSATSATRR